MKDYQKPSIIDNREGTAAKTVEDLRNATDALEGVTNQLTVIHTATKANVDLWAQVQALGKLEGDIRAAYLDLERELGLIDDYEYRAEGTRAHPPPLPDPDLVDAQRLAAIEEALKPTGWTESLEEGEAIAVQLPGGLVVTVERPDRAPHEDTVPSVEDRFGPAPTSHEWLDLAGLCDSEGNPDPGLVDCAVMLGPDVLKEYPDGGLDVPWALRVGLDGVAFDLPCAVLAMLDHIGRPSATEAVVVEIAVPMTPLKPGTVTARTVEHTRPAS